MKKNKKLTIANYLLATTLLLTACSTSNSIKNTENKHDFEEKKSSYVQDNTTEVLIDNPNIKKEDIAKIIKHGDHWHVFTKDGKEHITYTDPNTISYGSSISSSSVVDSKDLNGTDVVAIKKHGNHWHVYTRDGQEYITYDDPSSMFPDVPVTQYTGHHGDLGSSNYGGASYNYLSNSNSNSNSNTNSYDSSSEEHDSSNASTPLVPQKGTIKEAIERLHIVGVLGKKAANRYDIVKILQHEDHFHIYDSEGNEGITYTNPRNLYPNASFGQYQGSHGDNNNNNNINNSQWPAGITRIVDHGDHWHLYRGNTEVAVVHENPRSHYPNAEYIDERPRKHNNTKVENHEIFSYWSVSAELKDGILDVLDDNLKNMTNYGSLTDTNIPVYGSDGIKENIFYWLHNGNHYHAITIEQIIKNAKAGDYGNYTAKEVVAALKYIIQHPGEIHNNETKILDSEKIINFLTKHYNLKDDDIQVLGNAAYIYDAESNSHRFFLTDFKEENGKVVYKKTLPQITTAKSQEDLSESVKSAENKENVGNEENEENAENAENEGNAEKVDNSKKEQKDSKNKENKQANKKEEK